MPELPEVEIASRQLRSWLEGRRVVSARAEKSRVIRGQTQARFGGLVGRRLAGIEPRSTAAVVGNGARVEIWAEARWDAYSDDAVGGSTSWPTG